MKRTRKLVTVAVLAVAVVVKRDHGSLCTEREHRGRRMRIFLNTRFTFMIQQESTRGLPARLIRLPLQA